MNNSSFSSPDQNTTKADLLDDRSWQAFCYVCGEVSSEQREAFESRLQNDPELCVLVAEMSAGTELVSQSFAGQPAPLLPLGRRDSALAADVQPVKRSHSVAVSSLPRSVATGRWSVVVAAACLVCAVWLLVIPGNTPSNPNEGVALVPPGFAKQPDRDSADHQPITVSIAEQGQPAESLDLADRLVGLWVNSEHAAATVVRPEFDGDGVLILAEEAPFGGNRPVDDDVPAMAGSGSQTSAEFDWVLAGVTAELKSTDRLDEGSDHLHDDQDEIWEN